jgi:hypothetical protein
LDENVLTEEDEEEDVGDIIEQPRFGIGGSASLQYMAAMHLTSSSESLFEFSKLCSIRHSSAIFEDVFYTVIKTEGFRMYG